jgi:hypothetical protein
MLENAGRVVRFSQSFSAAREQIAPFPSFFGMKKAGPPKRR